MKTKHIVATLSGLVFAAAMGAPAFAAAPKVSHRVKVEKMASVSHKWTKKERMHWLTGKLASVDSSGKTITVKARTRKEGHEFTLGALVNNHTSIKEGKKVLTLADLKPGDRVRVEYRHVTKGGDYVRAIWVQSGAKSAWK